MEASSGRMDGRQAHTMPTLVSIADSMAAGELSKVGSFELEIDTKVCSRITDTRQTLSLVSVLTKKFKMGNAYIPPRPKTTMSALFCRWGMPRLFKTVIGRKRMMISCAIFTLAFENQIASWLRHFPFAMDLSQKKATG